MSIPYMIDTHCHLDSTSFDADLDSVIQRAFSHNVKKIIIPGADIHTLPKAREIAHKYEGVYFAAGVHPNDIADFDLPTLQEYVKDKKCIAIGECGLDYYRLAESVEAKQENSEGSIEEIKLRQKEVFIAQIELALSLDKPLVVHIREASNDSFEILQSYKNARGVLHCYNADRILLGLSQRFYYGIGGVCTFKNARRLIEALPLIPKERIVLETDAPYLTPHPHRGERNEPYYIPLIMAKLANVLEMSQDEVIATSTSNAENLFRELKEYKCDL
ncbi:TatD family hydrolase [Helicobacter labetoulli]